MNERVQAVSREERLDMGDGNVFMGLGAGIDGTDRIGRSKEMDLSSS